MLGVTGVGFKLASVKRPTCLADDEKQTQQIPGEV